MLGTDNSQKTNLDVQQIYEKMLKFTKQKIQMKITIVTLYSHQSLEN